MTANSEHNASHIALSQRRE